MNHHGNKRFFFFLSKRLSHLSLLFFMTSPSSLSIAQGSRNFLDIDKHGDSLTISCTQVSGRRVRPETNSVEVERTGFRVQISPANYDEDTLRMRMRALNQGDHPFCPPQGTPIPNAVEYFQRVLRTGAGVGFCARPNCQASGQNQTREKLWIAANDRGCVGQTESIYDDTNMALAGNLRSLFKVREWLHSRNSQEINRFCRDSFQKRPIHERDPAGIPITEIPAPPPQAARPVSTAAPAILPATGGATPPPPQAHPSPRTPVPSDSENNNINCDRYEPIHCLNVGGLRRNFYQSDWYVTCRVSTLFARDNSAISLSKLRRAQRSGNNRDRVIATAVETLRRMACECGGGARSASTQPSTQPNAHFGGQISRGARGCEQYLTPSNTSSSSGSAPSSADATD